MKKAGELNMCIKKIIFVSLVGLMLSACESDTSTTLQDSLTADNTVSDKDAISNYDLGAGIIPFPNDFLFAPNEAVPVSDGTINIPVEDITDLSDPKVAINGLDGFSTVAPITTGFNTAIDETSISGESVRVYPILKEGVPGLGIPPGPGGPATKVEPPLVFGLDYVAVLSSVDSTSSTLAILPLKPLAPKSSYAVVITNKLRTTSGSPFGVSASYALTRATTELYDLTFPTDSSTVEEISNAIKSAALKPAPDASDTEIIEAGESAETLEKLRFGIVKPTEDAIVNSKNTSIASNEIILQWTFTTQSTTDVLTQLRSDIRAADAPATAFLPIAPGANPVAESPAEQPLADIHVGTLDVSYFLAPASGVNDPAPLFSFWKGVGGSFLTSLAPNPGCLPAGTNVCVAGATTQTIPLLLSIPKTDKPAGGWPVAIFQHGITRARADMMAAADTMAAVGIAVVAIDMPMHGLDPDHLLYSGIERTFDLDLVDSTGAPGTDGVTDPSGTHYINLTNLQNTRDNVRQSISDLFSLVYALTTMDYDADDSPDFDTTKISFIGHSMGAVAGTTFLAHEDSVTDAVLAFSGGGLAKILDGSAAFGPIVAAGLAANGVIKGTADYESFLGAAQTVVDSGDAINHGVAAAANHNILFFEIVGGSGSPSDLVIPNRVADATAPDGTVSAPLAGTEPLIGPASMNLRHTKTDGDSGDLVVKFIGGHHGSLLTPINTTGNEAVSSSAEVFAEIQSEMRTYLSSGTATVTITDPDLLLAPAP